MTPALRAAAVRFRELWTQRVDTGAVTGSIICNDLTGQFASFTSPERHAFCTRLAADVAACAAQAIAEQGVPPRAEQPA